MTFRLCVCVWEDGWVYVREGGCMWGRVGGCRLMSTEDVKKIDLDALLPQKKLCQVYISWSPFHPKEGSRPAAKVKGGAETFCVSSPYPWSVCLTQDQCINLSKSSTFCSVCDIFNIRGCCVWAAPMASGHWSFFFTCICGSLWLWYEKWIYWGIVLFL